MKTLERLFIRGSFYAGYEVICSLPAPLDSLQVTVLEHLRLLAPREYLVSEMEGEAGAGAGEEQDEDQVSHSVGDPARDVRFFSEELAIFSNRLLYVEQQRKTEEEQEQ
eukprot:751285-Hanusia_phi.AAC.1